MFGYACHDIVLVRSWSNLLRSTVQATLVTLNISSMASAVHSSSYVLSSSISSFAPNGGSCKESWLQVTCSAAFQGLKVHCSDLHTSYRASTVLVCCCMQLRFLLLFLLSGMQLLPACLLVRQQMLHVPGAEVWLQLPPATKLVVKGSR